MSVLTVAELRTASTADASERDETPRIRPALKALPAIRRRPRGLIATVLAVLIAALGVVLAVNIHVAGTQYQVVQMQKDYRSLVHENEALTQQVQLLESPQSLSHSAVTLGMVMPATAGTFDLSTGELAGSAAAAESGDRPSNFVAAADYPGSDLTTPIDVAQEVDGVIGGAVGAGALDALISGASSVSEASPDQQSSNRGGSTHGGTIPAPSWD